MSRVKEQMDAIIATSKRDQTILVQELTLANKQMVRTSHKLQ